MTGKIKKTFKEVLEKAEIKSELYDFTEKMNLSELMAIANIMTAYKDLVGDLTMRDEWALGVLLREIENRHPAMGMPIKEAA